MLEFVFFFYLNTLLRFHTEPKMSQTVGSQGLDAETIKGLLDGSYGEATPPGWRKDGKLSTNQQKVYVHEETGKVVVSHRGTVGTAQDWFNNAVYGAFGDKGYELTGRYKKAKKTQKKAEKKYGAENISTIGHSQGGLLAQKVGGDSAEIITLNKATRPQDFFKRKRGEKQTDIRTEGDVVSMFKNPYETQGEQVTIKTDKFNPLAEHATDVLDRMKADKAADQAPEWSTSGRPPGTMISRVGRRISKSFFGRGPRTLEEMQGGNEHDDPEYETERDEVLYGDKYAVPRHMLTQILYNRADHIKGLKRDLQDLKDMREHYRDYISTAGEAQLQNRINRIAEEREEGKFGRVEELERKIRVYGRDEEEIRASERSQEGRVTRSQARDALEYFGPRKAMEVEHEIQRRGDSYNRPRDLDSISVIAEDAVERQRKRDLDYEREDSYRKYFAKRKRRRETARMSRAAAQRGFRDSLDPESLRQIDEFARRSDDPPQPTLTPWQELGFASDPGPAAIDYAREQQRYLERVRRQDGQPPPPRRAMSRATAEYLVRDRPNIRIPGGIRVRSPYPGLDPSFDFV